MELREAYLTEFIGHDLLDLTLWSDESNRQHHLSVLEHCLCLTSSKVTESCARMINALASLSRGRAYLAQNAAVVTLLTQAIFNLESGQESSARENLIGALQKLSLRYTWSHYYVILMLIILQQVERLSLKRSINCACSLNISDYNFFLLNRYLLQMLMYL